MDPTKGNSSIFWDDNQGPVVMVWDGMLPGEQSVKKTITNEDDWIIWWVKPVLNPREGTREGERERVGNPRRSPTFLNDTGRD